MYTIDEKFEMALKAREKAYAIYSNFKVGALLILKDGTVIEGCNVENSSYGLTNCAERTAIFSCIAKGLNPKDTVELVCIGDSVKPCSPCGACRQVMSEFFSPDVKITLFNLNKDVVEFKFKELLPYSFGVDDLENVK